MRRQGDEDRGDGGGAILDLAEGVEDRSRGDEEGEQRDDRQIGEVAGMDHPVIIGTRQHALDHLEETRSRAEPAPDAGVQGLPATSLGGQIGRPALFGRRKLVRRLSGQDSGLRRHRQPVRSAR